jgi:hypothetical protein
LEGFVGAVHAAPGRRQPSPSLGEDVRLAGDGVVGSGLELDGEELQLSAYTRAGSTWHRPEARIARPSRRAS